MPARRSSQAAAFAITLAWAFPALADECKRDPIRILFLGTAVGNAEDGMRDRVSRDLLQWLEAARGKMPNAPYAAVQGTIQYKDKEQQYKELVAIEQNNKTTVGFGRDFYEKLGYKGKFCNGDKLDYITPEISRTEGRLEIELTKRDMVNGNAIVAVKEIRPCEGKDGDVLQVLDQVAAKLLAAGVDASPKASVSGGPSAPVSKGTPVNVNACYTRDPEFDALAFTWHVEPATHELCTDNDRRREFCFKPKADGTYAVRVVVTQKYSPQPTPPSVTSDPFEVLVGAPPPSPSTAWTTQKILGAVSLGVGGAGLVIGSVTGALAVVDHGTLVGDGCKPACPSATWATVKPTYDHYHTMGAVSTAGLVAGGVAAGLGVVLLATPPWAPARAGFVVRPTLGGGTIAATGSF